MVEPIHQKALEGLEWIIQDLDGSVDPEIYDLIWDLNLRGYITSWSCAGHRRSGDWNIGFIHFSWTPITGGSIKWDSEEKKEIREIVEPYGLQIIKFVTLGKEATKTQRKGITFCPTSRNPYSEIYED